MSFKATLNLGDDKFRLLSVDFDFSQSHDYKTQTPTGEVMMGSISASTIVTKKSTLMKWMLERGMEKDGSIVFHNKKDDSSWRTLNFKKAYLVNYHESFSDGGELHCHLEIISPEISLGEGADWNASFDDPYADD